MLKIKQPTLQVFNKFQQDQIHYLIKEANYLINNARYFKKQLSKVNTSLQFTHQLLLNYRQENHSLHLKIKQIKQEQPILNTKSKLAHKRH